jgi:hypothetical protein
MILFTLTLLGTSALRAADVQVDLQPVQSNPAHPMMGDWMHFQSRIHNSGNKPIKGLVAWISLIEVTVGQEQPMDLEDWSAHKAISGVTLEPHGELSTDWPIRLIQGGDYRVVISVTDRTEQSVYTSRTLQFHVTRKPVVESKLILPVALGVPFVIGGLMGYGSWRRRRA